MRKIFSYLSLMFISVIFFSCEKEKGGNIDPNFNAPYLFIASVNPTQLNLDLPTVGNVDSLGNGDYQITIYVDGNALRNLADTPTGCYLQILRPDAKTLFSKLISLSNIGKDTFAFGDNISFRINRSEAGLCRLSFTIKTVSGTVSNTIQKPLLIARRNSPPLLSTPTMRQFTPEGSDSTRFTFTIFASDLDGLSDIKDVSVRAFNTTDSSAKALLDNGSSDNGDKFPGDGIFSTIIWIKPTISLPTVRFEFTAIDYEGAKSNIVERTFENRPPVIVVLDVPDSIQRPTSGIQLVFFYLTANDADGLNDIDSVYFRNLSSQTPTNILMYDDGNVQDHGDEVANDGIFSRGVSIDQNTLLGIKEFHFEIVDKSGAKNFRTRFITVYQ
jgi:hypothetical protein